MDKNRTLLAVVLSVAVIMIFRQWMTPAYPQAKAPTQEAGALMGASTAQTSGVGAAMFGEAEAPVSVGEKEIYIDTDIFELTFSNIGGSLKRVGLKEFTDPETGEAFELVNIEDPRNYIGAFSLTDSLTGASVPYVVNQEGRNITFTHRGEDVEIEKVFKISTEEAHCFMSARELFQLVRKKAKQQNLLLLFLRMYEEYCLRKWQMEEQFPMK